MRDHGGAPLGEIDEHERLGGRDHERIVLDAIRRALVRRARPADPRHPHEHLEQVVEPRGRVVLDGGRAHDEFAVTHVEPAQVPVVLDARVVEVGQVAPVVDDALRVRVREPHARERRVLEGRPPIRHAPELQRGHGLDPMATMSLMSQTLEAPVRVEEPEQREAPQACTRVSSGSTT